MDEQSRWNLDPEPPRPAPKGPVFLRSWWWDLRRHALKRYLVGNGATLARNLAFATVVVGIGLAVVVYAAQQPATSSWSSTTAAWVQGVGSIVAVLTAIWIAQGEARRARGDRRRVGEDARAARIGAIRSAAQALETAAHAVRLGDYSDAQGVPMSQEHVERLSAAEAAIAYYLRTGSEVDFRVLGALTLTEQIMARAKRDIGERWNIVTDANTWPDRMKTLSKAGSDIRLVTGLEDEDLLELIL